MIEKIVFVLPSIKTGGGNRVIIELSNILVKSNTYKVDLVYPNNSDENNTFFIDTRINLVCIGKKANGKISKLLNILKLFKYINKNYQFESIIFSDPIMSICLPLSKHLNLFRFVQADDYRIFDDLMILKNTLLLNIYKLFTKLSYQYNVKYIFNSRYTYDKFIQVSKRGDISFNLLHPAVNHEIFMNQNIRSKTELNICLIARKHPLKGFVDFLKPFNEGKFYGINHVYIISHDDLSDFDLSKVTLVKPNNDKEIAYYMNKSHIFVFTSWWEGFGLPPLEAMACGCAIVTTNAGGISEYAIALENSLVYEARNQHELIKSLNMLILDKNLQENLSKNAIKKTNEFSWEKSTEQLLHILRSIEK